MVEIKLLKRYKYAGDIAKELIEHSDWSTESIIEFLNSIKDADVVEVVRCKDCYVPHNKWLGCPHLNGLIPPPDFYCAKGTPKERGEEK